MVDPMLPADGTKPMPIAGRTVDQRERLIGMTNEERAWRAKWLKDQYLAPEEPIVPKDYYRRRYNPLRRFYRAPLEYFEHFLSQYTTPMVAKVTRHVIGKSVLGLIGVYCIFYNLKYCGHDWTRSGGFKTFISREAVYPGHPNFPNYEKRKQFATYGFENSPI